MCSCVSSECPGVTNLQVCVKKVPRSQPFTLHAFRPSPRRLLCCFALILVGRVVNIAVPLCFKRVVDTLSTVTAHVSKDGAAAMLRLLCNGGGTDAEKPSFTFWDVFVPWVAAYLALYFLQGRGVCSRLQHPLLQSLKPVLHVSNNGYVGRGVQEVGRCMIRWLAE